MRASTSFTDTPPTVEAPEAPATTGEMWKGIDLSYLDPSRVNWAKLNPLPPLHKLTTGHILLLLFGGVVALVVIVMVVLALYRLFVWNKVNCPVLLATPLRGADFTPMASTLDAPIYPVIDRVVLNNGGIALPYAGNELAFLPEPLPLPLLNNQVQFTLNFWMRVENFDYQTAGPEDATTAASGQSRYATLFAMNTGSTKYDGQFAVKYNSAANELIVMVMVIPTSAKHAGIAAEAPQIFKIPGMLLLQRWQMVTVVLDNRNLDVYHNSNLFRSYVLPNVPYLNNSSSNTGGGLWKRPEWYLYPGAAPFGGTIACARYFDYAMNVHEPYRLYTWDKPSKGNAPDASYAWWWTWSRGNAFTGLYRALAKDWHEGADYLTFGIVK